MRSGNASTTRLYPYATATPSPMSVNMFQRRLGSDASARAKKTCPPQSTTTLAKIASTQETHGPATSAIASATTGAANARLTQNLRVMSASSGFASDAADSARGSSAMPQSGQSPGLSLTTSGCIGQVQPSADPVAAGPGTAGAGGLSPRLRNAPGSA